MAKVPYEILAAQVNALYSKEFPPDDVTSINEHISFIQSFIEACGWSTDQYIERMWVGTRN